jgi:flagellar motor component MotA
MTVLSMKPKRPEAHLQLLTTLFLIFQKIRREGLMSIETDIERPKNSALFTAIAEFDESNAIVYTVLCDVLRLMVGGTLNITLMTRYLVSARRTSELSKKQDSLFDALEASVLSSLEGCAPSISVEFGRQCIPANLKPSFGDFEDHLRGLRRCKDDMLNSEETDSVLVRFFAGIASKADK